MFSPSNDSRVTRPSPGAYIASITFCFEIFTPVDVRYSRGRVNVYTASRGRQDLIAHRLRETADKLCEGSLTPLLTHLMGTVKLSRDQVSELRKLVDRMERRRED